MKKWRIEQLVEATHGKAFPEQTTLDIGFDSISTDSRCIDKHGLYVAIKGENFDGHAFIASAIEQGAVAALVSEVSTQPLSIPQILVADTRLALGDFARWHRNHLSQVNIAAITGSNGKTTCKEMVSYLLSQHYSNAQILSTQGNLNNDFGVPRTLLQLTAQHQFAVVEMGANHLKEIDYLSKMTRPSVALITIAAGAHLEGFGSLQSVIEAKSEMMNGMAKGSTIVLNMDSPGFEFWVEKANRLSLKVVSFGLNAKADYVVSEVAQQATSLQFMFKYQQQSHSVSLPMLGKHNALNALASLIVCSKMTGMGIERLTHSFEGFSGINGRLQQTKLPNGLLIDDSYNANPDSVKAAINALVSISKSPLLCLGAMAEIGQDSLQAHADIAEFAKQSGVKYCLCYGEGAKATPSHFGSNAKWFETHAALANYARTLIDKNLVDSCLVKGSRSAQMDRVVDTLKTFYTNDQ